MNRMGQFAVFLLSFWVAASLFSIPPYVRRDAEPLYSEILDRAFPFLEATVDLRDIAPAGSKDNLIPRAVVLPLEDNVFVCFDT